MINNYDEVGLESPDLKVLLVFADLDHVQAAADKPHIHQAFDGFKKTADLEWVRLNPDRCYVEQINPVSGNLAPDWDANTEPGDWLDSEAWGFPVLSIARGEVWLAAVAEMADRVQADNWEMNLPEVLYDSP